MSRKSRFDTLLVISETFKEMNVNEETLKRTIKSTTFVSLFDNVVDTRQKWKIKYKLSDLLGMIFFVLYKEQTGKAYAIADHIEALEPELTELGLLHDGQIPSHDTILRILTILDTESLIQTTLQRFYDLLLELEEKIPGSKKHKAFDGKEARGTGRSKSAKDPKHNIGTLNVFDTSLGTCITAEDIVDKESEIPKIQELLQNMNKKNTYFTADALHCQKGTCAIIHNGKGKYVLTVKDNQKTLNEEITAKIEKYIPKGKVSRYEIENRVIEILHLPSGYATDGWAGLKTFARMESHTRKNETIYRNFISNSTDDELICDSITHRWSCEKHHWNQDTFFNHDNITYTSTAAVHNLTVLLNLALQLITLYHTFFTPTLRKAKYQVHHHPVECIEKILAVLESDEIIDELKSRLEKKSFK